MAKARRPAQPQSPTRLYDLTGLVLFFLGSVSLIWLSWPQNAPVPAGAVACLRFLVGGGAHATCVVVMTLGALIVAGYHGKPLGRVSGGLGLLLLALITWAATASSTGGFVGQTVSTLLVRALAAPTTYGVLVLCVVIGCVLIVDRPLADILRTAVRPVAMHTSGSASAAPEDDADAHAASGLPARLHAPAVRSKESITDLEAEAVVSDAAGPVNAGVRIGKSDEAAEALVSALDVIKSSKPARKTSKQAPPEQISFTMLDNEAASEEGSFRLPPLSILTAGSPAATKQSQHEVTQTIRTLEQTLDQFGVKANVVAIARGPTLTRYEIQLAPGVKVSRIVSLADNLAMELAAIDVRLEAPIPGKSAIGVEVPNGEPSLVTLRDCLDSPDFWNASSKLTFALGKDVTGENRYADLARMPHLLIGGSTNSGKSVCLNSLIASLLYRATPKELKLLLIDPKRVELSLWDGIPHLMHPVVKDVKQAAGIFRAAIKEMERRYELFARMSTRNVEGYNAHVSEEEKLPFVVIVVDELADLMMQCAAEVETSICRLAQLARATGIHLVIATQRPSVNVITGTIKANIPSRIAFAVSSQVDSRTILDGGGAERLIGRGDMLFQPIDAHRPIRVQGCFLSEQETHALVEYLKQQERPNYTITPVDLSMGTGGPIEANEGGEDELFENAVRLVVSNGHASTSMLQRKFKIGYTRAARLLDMMEDRGIVSALDGAKPREILISRDEMDRMFVQGGD